MNLRQKLLMALSPLLLAVCLSVLLNHRMTTNLGRSTERVLSENYRSVLAAQRMKEAIERIDSAALFMAVGKSEVGAEQERIARLRFEEELAVQEKNITERGEGEATQRLREHWLAYESRFQVYRSVEAPQARVDFYFAELLPRFGSVKDAADAVLDMNQDAMVRKSEQNQRSARRANQVGILLSLMICLIAIGASTLWASRLLRPLSVLSQAARRIGAGDLEVKAVVSGSDEVAGLARDFNEMAQRLRKYQKSSLGDLLQAQNQLQCAIDSIPDPVLVIAAEGHLVNVNRAAEKILGKHVHSGSADWLAHLPPPVRDEVLRVQAQVLSGKGAVVPEKTDSAVQLETLNGVQDFLARGAPVYDEDGAIAGTTLVLEDVTRLRRFDELRSNLVATVAHEFRTPLTSIQMAIHLVSEQSVGPLLPKQEELLYAAREDCERLQSIVEELLDASRMKGGALAPRMSPVPVDTLLKDALDGARSRANAHNVHLTMEVLPQTGSLIVDRERMGIVLDNLLSNALRYSESGGAVTASAFRREQHMVFEIRDQGRGIPTEYQHRIFERHFRVPGHPAGGAGLGLSIAKDIVEEHGGTIGVESVPGQGSRFWFQLPLPREA